MTKIYIVEYHYDDYDDYTVYPIKAFRDYQKGEALVKECESENLRVDIEIENYWSKHQQEYDRLGEATREKIRKGQYNHNMSEPTRMAEIMKGEREILESHKHLPGYRANNTGGQFLCDTELELVE